MSQGQQCPKRVLGALVLPCCEHDNFLERLPVSLPQFERKHDPESFAVPASFPASTSPASPALAPTVCRACGVVDAPTVTPGTGPHYAKATCAHCGRFITWLSQYSHDERVHRRERWRREAMARRPATAPQMAYLKALGDTQDPPGSMAEASRRIDELIQQRQGQ